jgi:hypothetical protein
MRPDRRAIARRRDRSTIPWLAMRGCGRWFTVFCGCAFTILAPSLTRAELPPTKPVGTKPTGIKPVVAKPVVAKPVNTKPVVVKPMPPVEVIPPSLPPPPLVSQPETSVGATALGGLANDLVLQPLPPPIRRDPKQIRVGALIWAAGYLPAFIAPLLLWPKADTADGPSALANYSLLVPLLGPYISAIAAPAQAEEGNGRAVLSAWSVPWLLTSGLLQTTGFVMLLHGAIPRLREVDGIAVLPTSNGATVLGRF